MGKGVAPALQLAPTTCRFRDRHDLAGRGDPSAYGSVHPRGIPNAGVQRLVYCLRVEDPIPRRDDGNSDLRPKAPVPLQIEVRERRFEPVEAEILQFKRHTKSGLSIVTVLRVEHESKIWFSVDPPNSAHHLEIAVRFTPRMKLDRGKAFRGSCDVKSTYASALLSRGVLAYA